MLLKTYDKISDDTVYNWIIDCIDDSHNFINEKDIISKVCIKEFQFINSKKYKPKNNFKENKSKVNYKKKYKKRFKALSFNSKRFRNRKRNI